MSWFDPSICEAHPINCYNPAEWWRMAGGADARKWYNRATACPEQFPLGTQFEVRGSRWGLADGRYTCLDRGGRVKMGEDGAVLDLLKHNPVWGESLLVTVLLPRTESNDKLTVSTPGVHRK